MSRENVEVVRRAIEAWQRDDLEAWLSCLHPDIEWDTAVRGVEGTGSVYRGIEETRRFWTDFREFRVELNALRDVDDERVLAFGHLRWRGPASGIEVDAPLAQVFTVRDGTIIRLVDYLSNEQALEAVGLRE